MERPSHLVRGLKAAAIVIIVIVMAYPLISVIAGSFASSESAMSGQLFPTSYSLEAYRSILSGGVVTRSLVVTAGITLVGTTLSVLLTAMMAYGLTRTAEVPFSKGILFLVLATMFFGAGLIPNYLLIKNLGLIDSYWSVILPSLISAFNMIVVRNFFMNLPQEIFEAARIDGASEFRIFVSHVLPLSKAVLAVIGLFYAVAYWNTFFSALLYLKDASKWPIQLVLNQYVVQSAPTGLQNPDRPPPPTESLKMAVVVLATVPILIVYPFLQRFFTKGVLTGAIKG